MIENRRRFTMPYVMEREKASQEVKMHLERVQMQNPRILEGGVTYAIDMAKWDRMLHYMRVLHELEKT